MIASTDQRFPSMPQGFRRESRPVGEHGELMMVEISLNRTSSAYIPTMSPRAA
jgi:hypothetical protein